MNELMKRALFGTLYVGLMLWSLVGENSLVFLLFFSLLAFAAMWEYSRLVGTRYTRPLSRILDSLMAVYLVVALHGVSWSIPAYLSVYFVYVIYVFVSAMYMDREKQPTEAAKIMFGHLYVTLPLVLLSLSHGAWSGSHEKYMLVMIMLGIWANDTGAFLVGSQIGKRRMFPSLSPKKSWEGFFGGVVFSIVAVYLASTYYLGDGVMNLSSSIVIGILISVFATWGDLFESMLKRNAGVKDSGALIPGHGGVLDRIDSILFVVPVVLFVYVFL